MQGQTKKEELKYMALVEKTKNRKKRKNQDSVGSNDKETKSNYQNVSSLVYLSGKNPQN